MTEPTRPAAPPPNPDPHDWAAMAAMAARLASWGQSSESVQWRSACLALRREVLAIQERLTALESQSAQPTPEAATPDPSQAAQVEPALWRLMKIWSEISAGDDIIRIAHEILALRDWLVIRMGVQPGDPMPPIGEPIRTGRWKTLQEIYRILEDEANRAARDNRGGASVSESGGNG